MKKPALNAIITVFYSTLMLFIFTGSLQGASSAKSVSIKSDRLPKKALQNDSRSQIKNTKQQNKENNKANKADDEKENKEYEKLKKDLSYGTSVKRIKVIEDIVKTNKNHNLLSYVLKNDNNEQVLIKALDALGRLELTKYGYIIHNLLRKEKSKISPRENLILYTINTLGLIAYKGSAGDIIDILEDKANNESIKIESIKALGSIKSEYSLPLLYKIFDETLKTNKTIRHEIIRSLGRIGSKTSVKFLKSLLEGTPPPSPTTKVLVIRAITQCQGGFDELERYTKDKDTRVATTAISSLKLVKAKSPYEEARLFKIVFDALRDDKEEFRHAGLDTITNFKNLNKINKKKALDITKYIAFNDESLKVRKKAIKVLSLLGGKEVKSLWKENLKENTPSSIKVEIISSLNLMPSNQALSLLTFAYKQNISSSPIKKVILEAFFKVDHDKAVAFVSENIMNKDDDNIALKLYSVVLIYKNTKGHQRLEALKPYLHYKNIHIRRYAYNYLISINTHETRDMVFSRLKNESNPEVIMHILSVFYQKDIKESLPLLKTHFLKSQNALIQKEARRLIKIFDS